MVGSATRLNNSGQVIGYDSTPWNGSYQSFQSWIWQNGTFTDLGTVQRTTYLAVSLNNSGQVVGTLDGQAFLWQNGVMTDLGASLGSSVATGINDSGQVIGSFYDSFSHAYIWQNGAMTPLGTLGGRWSKASGINKYGQVVGASEMSDGSTYHAFLWQDGVMTDLGGLPGSPNSAALFINDSGQVTGGDGCGFLWENGVLKHLGTLDECFNIFGMNNAGQVVGNVWSESGQYWYPALWQNGTITSLGNCWVAPAYGGRVGGAIDNSGVIVGTSYENNWTSTGAFLWRNGVLTDLNTQLPVGSGWTLTSAEYINDAGQIVGIGTLNGEGGHTFLLTLDQIPPFVVTTTADTVADDGVTSLREALLYANTLSGPNSILFNIPTTDPNYNPATGVFTIAPTSPLPVITRTVTIDGTTQPGFDSTTPHPVIELNGGNAGAAVGLNISAGNCTVRGLAINRFSDAGIFLQAGGGNHIEGNFIGTDTTGDLALGNGLSGVRIGSGSAQNVIGGTTAATRNVISGNRQGVEILGGNNNIVEGNYIGINAAGTAAVGNSVEGIFIGLNGSGNTIGGTSTGAANIIAFNGGIGVRVESGSGNSMRANSIWGNLGLGINLGTGANNQQSRPVFASVGQANGSVRAVGSLSSLPRATFTIDIYGNTQADPSGYGQGQVYLGSITITSDQAGNAPFSVILPLPATDLQFLTATATDAAGNTSEFSQSTPIVPDIPPSIAPVANQVTTAGQPITVNFTLSDSQVDPGSLTVVAHSSNPAVLPDGNVILGGSGGARTITLTPSPLQTGVTTVTLVASDGLLSYTTTFDLAVGPRATVGFISVGSMSTGRGAHTATLLQNGMVLVAGGSASRVADLYDPSTGTFTATGNLIVEHSEHTATLLPNGEVLITGGERSASFPCSSLAERYDPTTGTFTQASWMSECRAYHTATLLPNGKVLVVGGDATAELYDPATGAFTLTGSLTTPRYYGHTASLLANGQVLIAGGFRGVVNNTLVTESSAELYDPATGTFSPTGSMGVGRLFHTATLLASGKVLVAGGMNQANAELYDPATGIFTATGNTVHERYWHTATLLPNGSVLLAGGGYYSGDLASTELYSPATGAFSPFDDMNSARNSHTATLLQNGAVLITGGFDNIGTPLGSAELLWPNAQPVANAGPDQTLYVNSPCQALVILNGTGSSDPDGDPLAYTWTGDFGTATGATPTVTLPAGVHVITLTVDDRRGGTASATVTVNVVASTLVANAGADQTVSANSSCQASVTLNGSASSPPDGEPLAYTWTGDFGTATGAIPTLTLSAGVHVITLTVDDRGCASASATVTVSVVAAAPVANAGPDQTVSADSSCLASVTLSGTGSTAPNGGPLDYVWTGDFGTATGSTPTVTLVAGTHVITLTVATGCGATASATTTVTVAPTTPLVIGNCPADITFVADANGQWKTPDFRGAVLPSACSGAISVAQAPVPGASLAPGIYPINIKATDTQGNASACSFDVTILPVNQASSANGGFLPTGGMAFGRVRPTATLLANGEVLVVGGTGGASTLAELYDPTTGTFSATGGTQFPRDNFAAVLLADGKVLVVGGDYGGGVLTAEVYDPEMRIFSQSGKLNTVRANASATLLPNGKVLVAGGVNSGGVLTSAELYDPASDTFALIGSMNVGRYGHTATLLPNGQVLITAGLVGYIQPLASAELYDPSTETFTLTTGSMIQAPIGHSATLLPNGKVLVTGTAGFGPPSAELYDPSTQTFAVTSDMEVPRFDHQATLLPNGTVLITGGSIGGGSCDRLSQAELYNPTTETFGAAGNLALPRYFHTATLLTNGDVLVAGGDGFPPPGYYCDTSLSEAELWNPSIISPPLLTGLGPSSVVENGPPFTLTVNGWDFANGAVVLWNGAPRPTTFVQDWQLTAALSSADIASSADVLTTATVMVRNPAGTVSNPTTFSIYNPNVLTAQSVTVGSGQTGIYLSDGNEHGFTGYVTDADAAPLAVTLAVYTHNPAPLSFPDVGAGYLALRIPGATTADSANVTFDFPADYMAIYPGQAGFSLLYFNGSVWAPVLSSGGVAPTLTYDIWSGNYPDGNASGNFTVVFDHTSTPKITELGNPFVFGFGIYPNLNYQNFANGAVGLGTGAFATGGAAGAGNTFWFDNFRVGAPGVPPQLISTVDYSDTFTLTGIRTDGLYNDNSSGAYGVENSYGNPPATWTATSGIFSFKTPATSTDPAALGTATGNAGASSGMAEATDIDFNFAYGRRSDYVVQVDAILPTDRLDISSVAAAGDSPLWYIGNYVANSLSVFFRRDSVAGTPWPGYSNGLPGIEIFNGTLGTGLYGTSGAPVLTGVNDNNWHNFAVEFDQLHSLLRIYVDRTLKARVDLATFALPAIICPADIVVTTAPGQTSAAVNFNVTATEANGVDVLQVVCNPPSGSAFPLGTTTVNCTASDGFGNTASCSFQVTVNPAIPTIATLSPANATAGGTDLTLTVNGSNFADGSIVQWNGAARATTFVSPNQLTAAIPSADTALANQNINTALITVQNPDGTISSPQAFTIVNPDVGTVQSQVATGGQTATASSPPTAPDQGGVTASLDNTSGTQPVTVTAATYTSNPGAGTTFDVGSTYVDLKVSGSTANNSMTSYFYYPATVTGTAEANLLLLYYTPAGWAPVLSSGGVAPAKDTTDNLAGTTSGGRFTVVFDGTSTPQITQLTGTPFALAIDTTPPTITCPANINLPCSVNLLVPVSFTVTATDNCDPSPKVVCTPASGSGFPVGTTTVNCRATDFSGNTSTCSFTVTRAPLGFSGFLAPIGGADSTGGSFTSPLRTFKMGSTVPVKFTASCGSSAVVTGVHTLQVIKSSNATTAGTPIDATPQGAATTGDQFRLSDGQWLFNLDTKATGMSTGIWLLRATLSDGSQHTVWVQLK